MFFFCKVDSPCKCQSCCEKRPIFQSRSWAVCNVDSLLAGMRAAGKTTKNNANSVGRSCGHVNRFQTSIDIYWCCCWANMNSTLKRGQGQVSVCCKIVERKSGNRDSVWGFTFSSFAGTVWTGIGCHFKSGLNTSEPLGGNRPARLASALIRVRSTSVLLMNICSTKMAYAI